MYDVTVDVGLCTSGRHDGKGEGEKKSIACLFCFVFFRETRSSDLSGSQAT